MTTDFLLELLSEEIPARMQDKAREHLAGFFTERLTAAKLGFTSIETYATPRRLALIVRGVAGSTVASAEERKGPRADAPEAAIEGFLRSTGLRRDMLVARDDKKGGQILFGVIEVPGIAAADIFKSVTVQCVRAFPWPKSMRWGNASQSTESLRWVRPLQGIVALLGNDVVDIDIDGIRSGAETVGHRFHHSGRITIGNADDYAAKLRACHVIVNQEERKAIIRDGATAAARAAGLTLVEDEGLVTENAGLTEWPVPLLGSFDPAFLTVPREVIQLTMRTNQKYFALTNPPPPGEVAARSADGGGTLAPNFICTANIVAADGGAKIVEGNRKVLAARLADAKFFWEQDLKTPLDAYLPKLENMLFYEGMGTLRAKADRISELAAWIAKEYFPERDPETARRAGLIAKADLATGMVGEFPELQGIMGGYYAERGGEKPGTVSALQQQYVAAVEGCIPACVALADRIDTLAAFFYRSIKPTGSKDPFALRRAALQTIQTILANGTRVRLLPVLDTAVAAARKDMPGSKLSLTRVQAGFDGPHDVTSFELLDFFADRLKVQQREAGVRHDLIDAVFALGGEDDLVRLLARVKALQSFVETGEGTNLLAGYKRASNILKKENFEGGRQNSLSYTPEKEEADLLAALDAAEPHADTAIGAEDFEGAMAALATLRAPIDAFFDKVTVNDADPAKRTARLGMLARVRDAVHRVADFSKIEG